jgi:hypothetical protein
MKPVAFNFRVGLFKPAGKDGRYVSRYTLVEYNFNLY